ncbi:MAG TPA: 1-acyl-sn-glycerol-3-phosphate acyltransferase [Polyangiaceae bacterium]
MTKKKRTRAEKSARPEEERQKDKKPKREERKASGRKAEKRAKAAGATPDAESPVRAVEPEADAAPRSARRRGNSKRPRRTESDEPLRLSDEAKTIPGVTMDPPSDAPIDGIVDDDSLIEEAPELGLGSRMVPPHVGWSDPLDSTPPASAPHGDVAEQIRALEARLDGLIRSGARAAPAESNDEPSSPVAVAEPVIEPAAAAPAEDIAARPFFEKQWGRESLRNRSEEVDDFGLDPEFEKRFRPIAEFLYRRYFRVSTAGISNVPASGRAIVVSNHSGTLPLDGLILRSAFRLEHPAARELRWLAEDFLFYLPFAGVFMNRVGAIRACQENAERLLSKERLVAVFPEGVQGIRKLFRERYRLQRFGRGGYIRLALRMRAPLVPCAIVGAEETNPLLYRVEYLASLFGLPYIPVTPTFPLLGPLGLVPAPSRWRIEFGEPISLDNYGPESAEDHVLVGRLSERVRATIQGMLDRGVRERRSVWFG